MGDFRSFAGKCRAYANDLPNLVNAIKQEATIEILTEVVPATPVDTGEARNNWNTSKGSPDTSTYRKGKAGKAGDASLSRGRTVARSSKPGESLHITNNAPHISRLNDGYSRQAPAGFVQKSIARGVNTVRKATVRFGIGRGK